jgi:spermidine synthase
MKKIPRSIAGGLSGGWSCGAGSASWVALVLLLSLHGAPGDVQAGVIFETTSLYHHMCVTDDRGLRVLTFDGAWQSKMSLQDPLKGHFEYTEYFHLPWLWCPNMERVLMIGLGGGCVQRTYQRDYPSVHVDTAEIDAKVVQVAREYFGVRESAMFRIQVEDGRVFLRRSRERYGAIFMDAYSANRYGSILPPHLVTREFFEMARAHLTTEGVLVYNVMGSVNTRGPSAVSAVYRTLKAVFPQVYVVPVRESVNTVLIATMSAEAWDGARLRERAEACVSGGRVRLPTFVLRATSLRLTPPPMAHQAPVLTDDRAPVESLY